MPRFHFHLRARGKIHHDPDGTELPDVAAARAHAAAVADELMRYSDDSTRQWSMCVEGESDESPFNLFFADVDPRLESHSPQMRLLMTKTCRRLAALTDAMCAARATRAEARILLARSRGTPQLVYAKGA